MFTPAMGRDDAALFTPAFAKAEYDLTAGAGSDNAEQTCAALDLRDDFGTKRFGTAIAIIAATATLAVAATLVVTGIWEHSDDGATYTEIGTDETMLTLTGGAGGSTETGAAALGCNLAEAKRFVRFKEKPNLSAADTDTAKVSVVYVLSSPSEL
ncbi:hypothetical protein [Azospirillum sp.]|uniref:hypothetical protein n=1 Tax=Azospirillum sp. TaxID=34012 RepID=UPI003D712349